MLPRSLVGAKTTRSWGTMPQEIAQAIVISAAQKTSHAASLFIASYARWRPADPRRIPVLRFISWRGLGSCEVLVTTLSDEEFANFDFIAIRPPLLRLPLLPGIPACRHGGE
jgi:hypothetical protein